MRKRKNVRLTLLMLILIMLLFPVKVMAKSKVILNDNTGIPDRVLYQTILYNLNKTNNDTFTENDAAKIKKLDANNYDNKNKINTLKGLEKLKNLKYLNVSFNNLTSLSGIEKLNKLEIIVASHNRLKDILEVKKLYSLSNIDVRDNSIKNINAIKKLRKLRYITIDNNKISNINCIKNLPELDSIYAQNNRLKELPNLSKLQNLGEVNFKYNCISEKEMSNKIPSGFKNNKKWFETQVQFQNVVKTIKIISPKLINKISKKTRRICGTTHKRAHVILRDPNGKKISSVKADNNGVFTFENLNFKKWRGKVLSIKSYLVDREYYEKNTLKILRFKVQK